MNELTILELGRGAVSATVMLSAPMLLAALGVGLVISILQAVTQINEATLSFVPKILAIFGVLAVAGPWLLATTVSYAVEMFTMMPMMAR